MPSLSSSLPVPSASRNTGGPSLGHINSSNIAMTGLVYLPSSHGGIQIITSPPSTVASPSQSTDAPPKGLPPPMFQGLEIICSDAVKQIFLNSRHDMTGCTYTHKWMRFHCWCTSHQVDAAHAPLPLILKYVLQIKQSELANSSIRVHLATITTFHSPIDGHSVFTQPLTKCFLRGI